MPDTVRGDFPKLRCSDCGTSGCSFKHCGPLVPPGESGSFCARCMKDRESDSEKGVPPKPVGHRICGVYTKAAFEGLRGMTEVWDERDFMPPADVFVSDGRDGMWWINGSFLVRGGEHIYLVYHGYKPAVFDRYFAVWVDGPFSESREIDVIREISRNAGDDAALFIELGERVTINVEPYEGGMGRRFRGLMEGGTLKGSRIEQVTQAVKMLI